MRLRPFNHTGPGQSDAFVIPAFAMQIARIENGFQAPTIRVGNLDAERDFLGVRDIVDAYVGAAFAIDGAPSGEIFNVASGQAQRIGDALETLLSLSKEAITVEPDPARMRASDDPRIVGDAGKLKTATGWAPRFDFKGTLQLVLDDCRARLRSG